MALSLQIPLIHTQNIDLSAYNRIGAIMELLDQAKTGLVVGLYHSAARDFTACLWENPEDEGYTMEARQGLMQCARLLDRLGFRRSARTMFRSLIRLCPGTIEAEQAITALTDIQRSRWRRAWITLAAGFAGHEKQESVIQPDWPNN